MKIYGPYTRKDNRQHIVIVHDDGRKQTKSYPRHLMEQHLQRGLTDMETVDHIDEDVTNNDITNLRVLSLSENIKAYRESRPRKTHTFICPCCQKESTKFADQVRHNRNLGKSGPFCSRSCAGKYTYKNPWLVVP